ncbi:MAG: hypothetical protein ACR2JC_21130 [Chloroflexota bacterium]
MIGWYGAVPPVPAIIVLAGLYSLLAPAPNPFALGLVRTFMSATVSVSNTVHLSYQLTAVPDALQGRVNSLIREDRDEVKGLRRSTRAIRALAGSRTRTA